MDGYAADKKSAFSVSVGRRTFYEGDDVGVKSSKYGPSQQQRMPNSATTTTPRYSRLRRCAERSIANKLMHKPSWVSLEDDTLWAMQHMGIDFL